MAIQMPTTQRDQLLAFGAIAAFAGIFLYNMYVHAPKGEELAKSQARLDSLVVQNDIARKEIARGTASKLREEAEMYGRVLSLMRTLVPAANEVPALIEQLSSTARRSGLDLGGLVAPTIINGDVFDTYKYRITVTGSYHKLTAFLTNVSSLQRIMAPMNVSLSPSSRPGRAGTGEALLDANLEIQTYVAKTAPRTQ
jgi:type IV pilus assembly protein PilO